MLRLNILKGILRFSRTTNRPSVLVRCLSSKIQSPLESNGKIDSKSINPDVNASSNKITEIPIQGGSDVRSDILRESLRFVEDKGWTLDAIRAGIQSLNQSSTFEGLFDNGYDLVEFFINDSNTKMSQFIEEKIQTNELTSSQILVEALKYRLSLVIPYAHVWDQALALGALPKNAVRSWKGLVDLSSSVWFGVGDKSTDINWYTKRMIVAGIYKSAEIYMLQDSSIDKCETLLFLERRLNDFNTFGAVRNSMSKSFSDTAQLAGGLFSLMRNLTSRR